MEQDYELNINTDVMCRICLAENPPNLKSIFVREIVNGSIRLFPEVFRVATDLMIEKNEGLPEKICEMCRHKVSEVFAFKEKCKNSEELLYKIFQINRKVRIQKQQIETACAATQTNVQQENIAIQTEYIQCVQSTQTIVEEITTESGVETTLSERLYQEIEEVLDVGTDEPEIIEETDINQCNYDYQLDENQEIIEEIDEDIKIKIENHSDNEEEDWLVSNNDVYYESNEEEFVIEELPETNFDVKEKKPISIIQIRTNIDEQPEEIDLKPMTIESNKIISIPNESYIEDFCNICSLQLNPGEQNLHIQFHQFLQWQIFNIVPFYRCGFCLSVFATVDQFDNHFVYADSCTNAMTIVDDSCTDYQYLDDPDGNQSQGQFQLQAPKRLYSLVKSDMVSAKFFCDYCTMELNFSSVVKCLNHFDKLHFMKLYQNKIENADSDYENSYSSMHRCGICGRIFPNLARTIQHVYIHSNAFQCPVRICSEMQVNFIDLKKHVEDNHMQMVCDSYCCTICSKEFKSYVRYQKHLAKQNCSGSSKCNICDKIFTTQASLNAHIRCHTSNRRFQCDVCYKRFMQKGDLRVHMRIHTGDRPYPCSKCPKTFRTLANRQDHMSTHEVEKKFQCKICQTAFISVRTLRGHMVLHKSEKQFQCQLCPKKFYRRTHVQSHMKTHQRTVSIPL